MNVILLSGGSERDYSHYQMTYVLKQFIKNIPKTKMVNMNQ